MSKKLIITVEDDVYAGLHSVIGRRDSGFLNDLARPHVTGRDLAEGYCAMAADAEREREAVVSVESAAPVVTRNRRAVPVSIRMMPARSGRDGGSRSPGSGSSRP